MAIAFSRLGRLALAGIVALGSAAALAGESPLGPTINIAKPGKCVEDTEYMRRNHMETILHQRDETVHEGIRTKKHSLKNCINCHADPKTNSVLGENGFCESCHEYASVSIDCFSCHSNKREPNKTAGAGGSFHGQATTARPALMSLTQEAGQ